MWAKRLVRKVIEGVTRKSRVDHIAHLVADAALEELGHLQRVESVLTHTQLKRLCASLREPAVKRARDRTDGVLKEAEPFLELAVSSGEDGSDDDSNESQDKRNEMSRV